MMVATAGHVDHGKTSLVKALTEIDTDTLAEERRRGMTIDIGFAYADLGSGRPTGFVDMPGHERFIRNLLAGATGIDLALLVIAADDGPMPQSREHLAILQLLGVPRCVVVLTKLDRVGPERLRVARKEVAALLAAGPYAAAPVFPVVATTGAGVAALRLHLAAVERSLAEAGAAEVDAGPATRHFRLAVDRSFTVAGAGRVVTGMALSGKVRVGDRLIVSPQGAIARVRGLRAQSQPVEHAFAGQRCAVNLVGGSELRGAEPSRGDWLVAPAAHAPTRRLDVGIELLGGAPRPLVDRSHWLLHIGAAAVGARVAVLFGREIAAGSSGLAQLILDRPVAALRGDRFILRDPAAGGSHAGGRVLDPFPPARGRSRPARRADLSAMALPTAAEALAAWLADAPLGVDLGRFALAWNLTDAEASRLERALPVEAVSHPGDGGDAVRRGLAGEHWSALRTRVHGALAAWHRALPESVGPSVAALAGRLEWPGRSDLPAGSADAVAALLHAALASLVADGSVAREGLRCRLASHRAVLSAADEALLARVAQLLAPHGLRPPIVGELASALALPLVELSVFLERAGALGALVRVASNRWFLPGTVAELAAQARQLAAASPGLRFDAAAYRDRTGIGRNLTVQVLEFLDREGVTRFDGNRRLALGIAGSDSAGAAAVDDPVVGDRDDVGRHAGEAVAGLGLDAAVGTGLVSVDAVIDGADTDTDTDTACDAAATAAVTPPR